MLVWAAEPPKPTTQNSYPETNRRWRKLTWEEVRQVLRAGFAEWQTLPDSVLTDNEMGLGGNPNDPFPSWLSLYLAGLGIKHNFIRSHRPTDQPQVERCHRTMDGLTYDECSRQDLTNFQQSLDQERYMYNDLFPSRASDCGGLPSFTSPPELLRHTVFTRWNRKRSFSTCSVCIAIWLALPLSAR